MITRYNGFASTVTIPDTIIGLPVTTIGWYAFSLRNMISIIIPNSVTTIGEGAFSHCSSLTSITIPNSVTNIGNSVFSYCFLLNNVTIPDSVTTIGDWTFFFCFGLNNITIGNSVTTIGDRTFYNCDRLTSITIPNNVTSIGNYAFSKCFGMTNVTIGNSVTNIGLEAFFDCSGLTSITIPSNVSSIGSRAFGVCLRLTSIYFKGNIPVIRDNNAFVLCRVSTIYYLPGTTGWTESFNGRPTALWRPALQVLRTASSDFHLNVSWAEGRTVIIEATTNITSGLWVPLSTNTLITGTGTFTDSQKHSSRIYRIRSL
jgi:hypothetical protein